MSDSEASTSAHRQRRCHLVGICGSGMRALAEVLLDRGWSVTGSDSAPPAEVVSQLQARGARVSAGHAAEHVPGDADLVVHSPAVPALNPELLHARAAGVRCVSYPQMLGELMQQGHGIAVAGTHGKSTTTALIGWVLRAAGLDPTVICGAELVGEQRSRRGGHGEPIVVESCEYRRGFLHLAPTSGVLLGVEPDHFDCFADQQELVAAFEQFVDTIPRDGLVLANADCESTSDLTARVQPAAVSMSVRGDATWRAGAVLCDGDGLSMRVLYNGRLCGTVTVPLAGRHHAINVLAAVGIASQFGVPFRTAAEALAAFPGLCRRFEVRGTWCGVTLVDDYAHHPTAVVATLAAVRQRYAGRRVVVVFEPHQVSRTESLMEQFADALCRADELLVVPVFAARESVSMARIDSAVGTLVEKVRQRGGPARAVASLDRVPATLDHALQPGDVLLTMGAGYVDRIHHELLGRLQRHSEAG